MLFTVFRFSVPQLSLKPFSAKTFVICLCFTRVQGVQGLPRATQSSIRGNITLPLTQERPDHDLREKTMQFCFERRVVVKFVESLRQILTHCFADASVRTRFLERHCRKQCSKTFQIHYDCVRAECSRLAAAIGSETEHWKRPRRESHSQSLEKSKSLRSTSTTNASTESDTKQGILSELAERLGRGTSRKTDQSMLETAKNMFSKLLQETNDDLDRALQPQEDQRAQATGNGSRCSRAETSNKRPHPLTEAAAGEYPVLTPGQKSK